jgi:hypothetical protein
MNLNAPAARQRSGAGSKGVTMTDRDDSTEGPAREWSEAEQAEQYNRARKLVLRRCPTRPEDWREDAASVAWENWRAKSRGAPVNQWVTWAINDKSKNALRELADASLDDQAHSSPWASSTARDGGEPLRYTKDKERWLYQRARADAERRYETDWASPWSGATNRFVGTDPSHGVRVRDETELKAEDDMQKSLDALRSTLKEIGRELAALPIDPETGAVVVFGPASNELTRLAPEIAALRKRADSADQPVSITITNRHGESRTFSVLPTNPPPSEKIGALNESPLRRFVERALTQPDFLRAIGCSRVPTVNEMADIWLLGGGTVNTRDSSWEKGISVSDLLEALRARVKAAATAVTTEWGPLVQQAAKVMGSPK